MAFSLLGFVDDIQKSKAFKGQQTKRLKTDEETRLELEEREKRDERERNERLPLLAQMFPNKFESKDFFSELGL